MRRAGVAALVACAVTAPALLSLPAAALAAAPPALSSSARASSSVVADAAAGVYVVALRGQPLATYEGSITGYPATAPEPGQRFDASRPSVLAYQSHLLQRQASVLASVGSPEAFYHYTVALNGFAARLTAQQVKLLRSLPDVVTVQPDTLLHLDAAPGDHALKTHLPAARPGHGADPASARAAARAGRKVVIGVIDSGLWPDNPSFAAVPAGTTALRHQLPGFTGTCQHGEAWTMHDCNAKVVAARYFVRGFGRANIASAEFASPRDGSGHGSHVAADAAGNAGVAVTIGHQGFGWVSGADPSARLAVYKACWVAPDPTQDGCSTLDALKSIDQAVSDGVDVINYSISSGSAAPDDVVELAFLHAASAGVVVVTAAGNGGPAPGTVQHTSPWETTVAASNLDPFAGEVRLGNDHVYPGSMVSSHGVGPAPLVYAGNAARKGGSERRAAFCNPGSLDATVVDQAIVVCDRGVIARVLKSEAVAQAGGAGMVLVNRVTGSTVPDVHAVPTVHVGRAAGVAIKAYAASSASPTARLVPESVPLSPPEVADFSGRGPTSGNADVLKPDVAAPGVGIVGAVAPVSNFGHLWDVYTGTSVSAPVVAGAAGRIIAAHPAWSPAEIRSALMTTAVPVGQRLRPFAQGAGQVAADRALDPGLVYDTPPGQWTRYLDGVAAATTGATRRSPDPLDPSRLNQPSIEIDSLVGHRSITRTVTNVSGHAETYVAHVDPPRGIAVSVAPNSFTVAAGATQGYSVTFDARRTARYEQFATGRLRWTGSAGHVVTGPLVVRPELVTSRTEVSGTGASGVALLRSLAGVTGTLHPHTLGLTGAHPVPFSLSAGTFDAASPAVTTSTQLRTFSIDQSTSVARFDLHAASPGDDVDLYVYRNGSLVASSASVSGDERVTLTNPRPGSYDVYVTAEASGTGAGVRCTLTSWLLGRGGRAATAPLTVSPDPVTVTGGRPFRVDVTWSGLDLNERWFGFVGYRHSGQRTYLTVN